MEQRISCSEEETRQLGFRFGSQLSSPAVVMLIGDLGSGKTVFVRGICQARGVPERLVRSPSFTLINEYPGDELIRHADLYRLGDVEEIKEIGLFDYLEEPGIILVEWAERLPSRPEHTYRVFLRHLGDDRREIRIYLPGEPEPVTAV